MPADQHHYFPGEFDSIETLADRISETLGCPITIEDANHRIIAYSRHEGEIDPVRIATIMRRKVPEHVINSLWKSGAIPTLFETDEPVVIPAIENVSLGSRVAISVRKQGKVIGFIWAQAGADFSEEQKAMLTEAAHAVKSQLLQHEKRKRASEESHQEFFWKLLTGHFNTKADVESANRTYGLPIAGVSAVIVFDFRQPVDPALERQIDYVVETVQKLTPVAKTYDGEQLIVLVKEADDSKITQYTIDLAAKSAERLGITPIIGAGSTIQTPLHIPASYQEALYVLRMKGLFPETPLPVHYHELGIFQSIEAIRSIRAGQKNRVIEQLDAYDNEHHANMVETLYTFLSYDGNINDAAKTMHVHPNTLAYRMKRIAELTGFNSRNMNEKTLLYMDLLIRQMEQSAAGR